MPHQVHPHTEYVLERQRWEAGLARSREHREVEETKSAAPAPAADFWETVDERIEHSREVLCEIVGEVVAHERRDLQEKLTRRDERFKNLKRELRTLRAEVETKISLQAELTAARAEIAELRARAPDFKSELAGLREQVAKQERLITKLRGQASQLEYGQAAMERQQSHQRVEMTAIEIAAIGSATREVLQRLREEGFDIWDVQPPSRLAS